MPVWDLPLDEVHLTRTDGRAGRRAAGIAQHCGTLPSDHVVIVHGVLVTSPVRTAFDVAAITDVEHGLCLVNDVHLLAPELTPRSQLLPRGARRVDLWTDTLTTDLVIRLADGRLESAGSRGEYMFWRGGLPAEPQYKCPTSWARLVARVDFAWPEYGVFLEFDGRVKYEKYRKEGESELDAILREKKREERICRLTGWRCIRIVWADLYRPEATIAYIRGVLAGGPVH